MISRDCFGKLAEALLEGGAKKATKYFSSREVVKATFVGKRRKEDWQRSILFTIGRPNYAERAFIKQAQKAGESFPMKRLILKFPAARHKSAGA